MTPQTKQEPCPFSRATILLRLLIAASLIMVMMACGDDTSSDEAFGNQSGEPTGQGSSSSSGGFVGDVFEQPEQNFRYLAPRAGRDYIFVPNETLDTVSKIDADSLAITTIPVGDRPTRIEAVEQENFAVVLNQDSDQVSIIRADALPGPSDEVVNLTIDERMNDLILSPDGEYAFAFFSYARQEDGEPDGNLQTVSFIRTGVGAEAVFSLSIGFQVRGITFRTEGSVDEGNLRATHAYIITDTGLSIVTLDAVEGDLALPIVQVTPRSLDDPLDREVYVAPSGEYAIARDVGAPELYIVRLSDGVIQTVTLPGLATDLDLFPPDADPTADEDRAIVLVRDQNQVMEVPLDAAFIDPVAAPRVIEAGDEVKGLASIDATGRWLVLYTTLGEVDRMTLVDLSDESYEVIRLRKSIRGVAVAGDGQHAIVFHPAQTAPESASSAEALVLERPGYSVVDLESGFTRLVSSRVEVEDFTFWGDADNSYAFLSFVDEDLGIADVDHVDLNANTVVTMPLGSPPSNLGRIFGRQRVWINQDHPLGRITFIDVFSGEPRTVTGFELNRRTR